MGVSGPSLLMKSNDFYDCHLCTKYAVILKSNFQQAYIVDTRTGNGRYIQKHFGSLPSSSTSKGLFILACVHTHKVSVSTLARC